MFRLRMQDEWCLAFRRIEDQYKVLLTAYPTGMSLRLVLNKSLEVKKKKRLGKIADVKLWSIWQGGRLLERGTDADCLLPHWLDKQTL